ncbi:MAG: hypothetical protein IPK80_03700 [Nannocystis sp.]|nr:hypothetical protein [Nannocystis sp.]
MSAIYTPIFTMERFDFTWLGSSASHTLTLHRALSVVQCTRVQLSLRLHSSAGSGLTGSQAIVLAAYGTNPSPVDPREFTKTTPLVSITANSSSTFPSLLSADATDPDPFLKIVLTFTQGATGGTPLWVELSADFLGRHGG